MVFAKNNLVLTLTQVKAKHFDRRIKIILFFMDFTVSKKLKVWKILDFLNWYKIKLEVNSMLIKYFYVVSSLNLINYKNVPTGKKSDL